MLLGCTEMKTVLGTTPDPNTEPHTSCRAADPERGERRVSKQVSTKKKSKPSGKECGEVRRVLGFSFHHLTFNKFA